MPNKPRHRSCAHKQYAMSCDEYDAMRTAANGDCQMCGKPTEMLVIDHDHALGAWAVRGLVCTSCNVTLGRIEGGHCGMRPTAHRYLNASWHQANGWTSARGGFREQIECSVCGRMVGAMLNGIPYLHRVDLMSDVYCAGTTLEQKSWRKPKPMGSTRSPRAIDPSVQPWFRGAVTAAIKAPHQRPDFMSDKTLCGCGHSGTAHETSQQCRAAGDSWDCPCQSYEPDGDRVAT